MKNPANDKVAKDIRDYGWHCLHVAPRVGEEGASFTYTIGLLSSYHHPELMIFGLGRDKSHRVLCECVEMIKSGTQFPINERVSDVLARDFHVMFKPIRKECFGEYLGTAVRHYGHNEFGPMFSSGQTTRISSCGSPLSSVAIRGVACRITSEWSSRALRARLAKAMRFCSRLIRGVRA